MLGTACFGNKSIVEDVEILLTIQMKEHRENQIEGCALGQIKEWVLGLKWLILKRWNKITSQIPLVILYLQQVENVWNENILLIFFFFP